MPLRAEELIEKSKDQRNRSRNEEALVSALAGADAEPENAEAWWQVSLSHLALGDNRNAVTALRKTVDLWPEADGAWSRLGAALTNVGEKEEAKVAFLTALDRHPGNLQALEAISLIYSTEDAKDQDEDEASVLSRIEKLSILNAVQLNRFGILHYRSRHFYQAIKYWRDEVTLANYPACRFNLGLAYSQPEVSQDADAVDMWRLALHLFPDYEPAEKRLAEVLPKMLRFAAKVRHYGETLLPRDRWYEHYLNPFELINYPDDLRQGRQLGLFDRPELLNYPEDLEQGAINPKTLQMQRKSLLAEIELEGVVPWIPDAPIDKSRAISLCEELSDESKRQFHWNVFKNKPLLGFLSKGAHEHFLVSKYESPLDTLELIEDEDSDFLARLGDFFVPQFDRVLSKAIDAGNLVILECLMDGRRWVPTSQADRCFQNTRRVVDRLLQPLRDAHKKAEDEKPVMGAIEAVLNRGSMFAVLNLLPCFFDEFQNETVNLIRGIALSCFKPHDDIDLSRQVVELAKRSRFCSDEAKRQIEEDVAQIETLIRQERQYEAKLTRGSEKWEITKEGARIGDRHLSAADVSAVRWGTVITGERWAPTYDFLISVGTDDGRQINYAWRTSKEIESSQKHFQDLINAASNYLLPSLIERLEERLASGQALWIGPCKVSKDEVEFDVEEWFRTRPRAVPWQRILASVDNGEMTIQDEQSPKIRVTFSVRDTDNAIILRFMADTKNGRKN